MKKAIILLAVAVVLAGAAIAGAFALKKSPPAKASAASKTPGVAVNLIACGTGQSGVECIAIYKGSCAVFVFDQSGKITTAQPVDPKYCGQ